MNLNNYTAYFIYTCYGTYINLGTASAYHNRSLQNPLYFMPINDHYAILINSYNIKLFNHLYISGESFRIVPYAEKWYAHLVEYIQCKNGYFMRQPLSKHYYIAHGIDDKYPINMWGSPVEKCKFNFAPSLFEPIAVAGQEQYANLFNKLFIDCDLLSFDKILIDVLFQMIAYSGWDPVNLLKIKYSDLWLNNLAMAYCNEEIVRCFETQSNESHITRLDYQHDFCSEYYKPVNIQSAADQINFLLRNSLKQEDLICVVACARNEGPYLLEFIAHYRALGIDDIYIYSNDNNDDSEELLELLAHYKIIHYINNDLRNSSPQRRALAHAFLLNGDVSKHKYCICIDIDEFVFFNPDRYASFSDFIEWHEANGSQQIALNWVQMHCSSRFHYSPSLLLERFRTGLPRSIIKSIINPRCVGTINCHYPRPVYGCKLNKSHANGNTFMVRKDMENDAQSLAYSTDIDIDHAGVMHFIYKSFEEVIYKYGKDAADAEKLNKSISFRRFDSNCLNGIISSFDAQSNAVTPLSSKLLAKTKAEYAMLMKSPRISQIQSDIIGNFPARLKQYKQAFAKYLKTDANLAVRVYEFLNMHGECEFLE